MQIQLNNLESHDISFTSSFVVKTKSRRRQPRPMLKYMVML